jgi:hypothetical protein
VEWRVKQKEQIIFLFVGSNIGGIKWEYVVKGIDDDVLGVGVLHYIVVDTTNSLSWHRCSVEEKDRDTRIHS